jgi:hypothetical protein
MRARITTKIMLMAALLCLIFLVSCVEQGDDPFTEPDGSPDPAHTQGQTVENPGQLFRELVGKTMESDDYLIVYQSNSTMMESMSYSYDNDVTVNLGVFRKKGREKLVMEMRAKEIGTVSFNRVGNKTITCEKGDPSGYGSDEWECSTSDTMSGASHFIICLLANKYAENFNDFDDYTVEHIGEKEILGRKCQEFEVIVEDLADLMLAGYEGEDKPDISYLREVPFPTKAKLITCLDEATGHELYSKVMGMSESELLDETYDDFAATVAKRFEQGIDDSEFDLPVLFTIERSANDMDELLLFIRPYQPYNGPAELRFYDHSWYSDEPDEEDLVHSVDLGTLDIDAAELHSIMVEHGLSIGEDSYGYKYWTYELCLGDDCATDRFYLSNSTTSSSSSFDCLKLSLDEVACEADEDCRYSEPYCVVDYYSYSYPTY